MQTNIGKILAVQKVLARYAGQAKDTHWEKYAPPSPEALPGTVVITLEATIL